MAEKPHHGNAKATFEGFFFHFGLGYALDGGEDGPEIPDAKGTSTQILLHTARDYTKLVTTKVGAGPAANFQIGYNIKGFVSLWFDLGGHGNPSSAKADLAGSGAASAMLGLHPLRFWRDDLPADVKLYGGYSPFEILGYNENQAQPEYKGKAWIGTAIPFGLMTQWKPALPGIFTLGLDLRFVRASYDKWYWNWDREEFSSPSPAVTTLRFEPRLTLGIQL